MGFAAKPTCLPVCPAGALTLKRQELGFTTGTPPVPATMPLSWDLTLRVGSHRLAVLISVSPNRRETESVHQTQVA